MARPIKDGVDYFPKDTDFYSDDKVRILRAEFGAKGMYLLDYLLCDLYSKNGYFIKWDKSKCFLVSDDAGCGCTPDFIEQFIQGCSRCSFFDERVFKVFGVLTSAGIQRRYIRMFNSRDEIQINKEYWLLDTDNKKDVPKGILDKLTFFNDKSTDNPDKSTDNTQSKVKENKVNKTKEDIDAHAPKKKYGEYNHVLLTDDEYKKLAEQYDNINEIIEFFDNYIEEKDINQNHIIWQY